MKNLENNEKEPETFQQEAEKLWSRFESGFWGLFVAHLLFNGLARATEYQEISVGAAILGLIVILIMVGHVAWHSYLLSQKKKTYALFGVLGLWWVGVVGIFVAYFAVRWIYYKATDRTFSLSAKVTAGILTAISLLVAFSLGSSLLSFQEIGFNNTDSVRHVQEWSTVTTPNGRLTMTLPRNPTYEYTKPGGGSIEGYSYIAEEHDGHVNYVVKYENWQSIADKEGIEIKNLDDERLRELLKSNVDLEIEEFNVSNFVSEFITIHGYRAIKFNGQIKDGGSTADIKGVSLFVEEHLYTFVVLADSGYSANLERLLNSVSFNVSG